MKTREIAFYYLLRSLVFAVFFYSYSAFAGEVVKCHQDIMNQEHRCIIQLQDEDRSEKGDQVILYNAQRNWIATGDIIKVKDNYSIAVFRNGDPKIHRGLEAVFEEQDKIGVASWDQSFKKVSDL